MPWKAKGSTRAYPLQKASDRVCYSINGPQCVENVEFLTANNFGDEQDEWWSFFNYLGVAPVDSANGPNFVQKLKQKGLISAQSVTIYYSQDDDSSLIFGPVQENSEMIKGQWFSHQLKTEDSAIVVEIDQMELDDSSSPLLDIATSFLLQTEDQELIQFSADQAQSFYDWAESMSKIDGVNCGTNSDFTGLCSFNEEDYDCQTLWRSMKSLKIKIGSTIYELPPWSQTIQEPQYNKICQPGIFLKQRGLTRPVIGRPFF